MHKNRYQHKTAKKVFVKNAQKDTFTGINRFCKIDTSCLLQSSKKGADQAKTKVIVAVVGVVVVAVVDLAVVVVVVVTATAVVAVVVVVVGIPDPLFSNGLCPNIYPVLAQGQKDFHFYSGRQNFLFLKNFLFRYFHLPDFDFLQEAGHLLLLLKRFRPTACI